MEVLRIVEVRGLATQDAIWNYTETEDPAGDIHVPRREVQVPPRTDRAEARALLAAYGTSEVRVAFEAWLGVVEAWEAKTVEWRFAAKYAEPPTSSPTDGEPERTKEREARSALGDRISREVSKWVLD